MEREELEDEERVPNEVEDDHQYHPPEIIQEMTPDREQLAENGVDLVPNSEDLAQIVE